jgi:predicted metal-dependent hydrolase
MAQEIDLGKVAGAGVPAGGKAGQVLMKKSTRARRISLRVHPVKGVSITVPYIVPYMAAEAFFKLKRQWVIETMVRQKDKFKDVQPVSRDEIEQLRKKAKAELPSRLDELAARYGFAYNKVAIKHNATNWGSCSARNNINLNLNIVRLPKALQDYILLHELCHIRHHDHGHGFHLLLEHVLTDNLLKLVDAKDETALELARKAAVSKAKYPADYVMTKAIKQYRLI